MTRTGAGLSAQVRRVEKVKVDRASKANAPSLDLVLFSFVLAGSEGWMF